MLKRSTPEKAAKRVDCRKGRPDRFVTTARREKVPVSSLKSIAILCEHDLYDLALLLLRLYDAKYQDTNRKTRSTVHGLAALYGRIADVDSDQIEDMLQAQGLLPGATIEHDQYCNEMKAANGLDD